jgi:hypothetical protein
MGGIGNAESAIAIGLNELSAEGDLRGYVQIFDAQAPAASASSSSLSAPSAPRWSLR